MTWVAVWSLKRDSIKPAEPLPANEALAVDEQLERERRMVTEHGVRIPAWSDEAKVIWDPRYLQRMRKIALALRRVA